MLLFSVALGAGLPRSSSLSGGHCKMGNFAGGSRPSAVFNAAAEHWFMLRRSQRKLLAQPAQASVLRPGPFCHSCSHLNHIQHLRSKKERSLTAPYCRRWGSTQYQALALRRLLPCQRWILLSDEVKRRYQSKHLFSINKSARTALIKPQALGSTQRTWKRTTAAHFTARPRRQGLHEASIRLRAPWKQGPGHSGELNETRVQTTGKWVWASFSIAQKPDRYIRFAETGAEDGLIA